MVTAMSGTVPFSGPPGSRSPSGARSPAPARPPAGPGDLNEQLLHTDIWSDHMVQFAGIPIVDVPFVSVGGGIGSFVMVDYLRIAGVPTSHIAVLGAHATPWHSYQYLTQVSQIPLPERIRSDSSSTPDSI